MHIEDLHIEDLHTEDLHTEDLQIEDLLQSSPVVPVLVIPEAKQAVPLARALLRGGLSVLEVTLRRASALESIRRIAAEVPEVTVGAGTVTRPEDFANVRQAGGRFAVSPGLTPRLAQAAKEADLPFLPGVMTASEALAAREQGFSVLKLFPASVAGGVGMLKALRGPLPDLRFCPTGGIKAENYREYLGLPNVICVGGSWVAPRDEVQNGHWDEIERLARQAVQGAGA